MFWDCEFGTMNKGACIQFLKGETTHRFPKMVTLAVASTVLVAMVTLDASAATKGYSRLTATGESSSVASSTGDRLGSFRHHGAPTTTTSLVGNNTTSAPTTTSTSAPTTTTNAPTTTTNAPPTTTNAPTTTTTNAPTTTTTAPAAPASPTSAYPTGTVDGSEPSGYAPPGANALAGYNQSYVTDFTGSTLPTAWDPYEGQPGGDPGAQFDAAHLAVGGGLLNINTYQDPAFNNKWVTGGTCLCGITSQTYGAYFVRSRVTGAGPTGVELLWPAGNTWPPEIDFNETYGDTAGSSATLHYGASNSQIQRTLTINMTQWHTWGVIWTPTSITYTVDGNVWGTVTNANAIPNGPMYISLQSQTWCSSNWACPTTPQSMQVDWVAQYKAN